MQKTMSPAKLLEAIEFAIKKQIPAGEELASATIKVNAEEKEIMVEISGTVVRPDYGPFSFLRDLLSDHLKERKEAADKKSVEKKIEPKYEPGGPPAGEPGRPFCTPWPITRDFCKPFPPSLLDGNWMREEMINARIVNLEDSEKKLFNLYQKVIEKNADRFKSIDGEISQISTNNIHALQRQIDELKKIAFTQQKKIAKLEMKEDKV